MSDDEYPKCTECRQPSAMVDTRGRCYVCADEQSVADLKARIADLQAAIADLQAAIALHREESKNASDLFALADAGNKLWAHIEE